MSKYFLFLKLAILILLVGTSSLVVTAQQSHTIKGTVLEATSQGPIAYASVVIMDPQNYSPLAGNTTDESGSFEVMTTADSFIVEITFIGFAARRITDFDQKAAMIDLGTILMKEDDATLEEVTVRAQKSQTEFKLDRRVFNVGQDISSSGAGALEVLNQVPSVTVDVDGEIKLRGSAGVQILINGKPSVIASEQGTTLGNITADMIDKIELITNPSAKYDASGTAGIINIVLRKEEKKGLNGSVTLNLGIPSNNSVGLSLNRRTDKFNLFSQVGVGYRELPRESFSRNNNISDAQIIESNGTAYRNEQFYNIVLGTDYYMTPHDVWTLSGSFAYEIEDQPSSFNFEQWLSGASVATWKREETTSATNPKLRYELQYKKDFKRKKDHNLIISGLGHLFAKDQKSTFTNPEYTGSFDPFDQRSATKFKEEKYTFNIDYTNPLSEQWSLEAGSQYVLQDVSNDYEVDDFLDNNWVSDPNLTNTFKYNQDVLGVYTTLSYQKDKFGVKGGLRLEATDLKTTLTNTNQNDHQKYVNFFPSFHTSYKFGPQVSLQAGYSRRINRPRLWDLNPFFNIRDNFNIWSGNPELLPEFTDSYELTSVYILDKISMNLVLYYRYTTDVHERVSTFQNNVNTYSPKNIGTNATSGIEYNAKIEPAKWMTLNWDFNWNAFNRKGDFESRSFDFTGNYWTTRLAAKINLPIQLELELSGQYESAYKSVQFDNNDLAYMDIGLRQKILKGKLIISAAVRDVFASRINIRSASEPTYSLYNRSFRSRFLTVGISYGFGKGEAMEFKGRRRI